MTDIAAILGEHEFFVKYFKEHKCGDSDIIELMEKTIALLQTHAVIDGMAMEPVMYAMELDRTTNYGFGLTVKNELKAELSRISAGEEE